MNFLLENWENADRIQLWKYRLERDTQTHKTNCRSRERERDEIGFFTVVRVMCVVVEFGDRRNRLLKRKVTGPTSVWSSTFSWAAPVCTRLQIQWTCGPDWIFYFYEHINKFNCSSFSFEQFFIFDTQLHWPRENRTLDLGIEVSTPQHLNYGPFSSYEASAFCSVNNNFVNDLPFMN